MLLVGTHSLLTGPEIFALKYGSFRPKIVEEKWSKSGSGLKVPAATKPLGGGGWGVKGLICTVTKKNSAASII